MEQAFFRFCIATQRRTIIFLCMVMVSMIMVACGPSKKYAGPYLPDEEIAIIKPGDKMFTHVNILSVDKVRLYRDESGIKLLPGKHTLFFESVLDYPFLDKYLYFNQYLTFNAEAGHNYTLHSTILPMRNEGFAWISSDREPEKFIVKKYAVGLIPLSTYP